TNAEPPTDPFVANSMDSNRVLETEERSLLGAAEAQTQAEKNTAAAYGRFAHQQEQMLTPEQIQTNHQRADESLDQDYANKTNDPDLYCNSNGTGSKIAAGL